MALEAAFVDLSRELVRLREHLQGLHLTVAEDVPEKGASALADKMADTIDDLRGLVEEALGEAAAAQQAVGYPPDLDRAWRALAGAHGRWHDTSRRLASELMAYRRLSQLARLGRDRGQTWNAWVGTVNEGLERCQQATYAVSQALLQCWQEIAERVGMNSVSVQATNIGQQITVPAREHVVADEMT